MTTETRTERTHLAVVAVCMVLALTVVFAQSLYPFVLVTLLVVALLWVVVGGE